MPEVLSWYVYTNLALHHLSSHSKTNQAGPLSALSLFCVCQARVR